MISSYLSSLRHLSSKTLAFKEYALSLWFFMRTKEKSKGYKLLTDQKGKKLGVVLTLKEYRELMEDLHDISVVLTRKDEELVSLEDIKRMTLKR